MKAVLDASALLAYLQDEPGNEAIEPLLDESAISSVNWAEVVQKSIASGVDVDGLRDDMEALGLSILPFTPEEADTAGRLWLETRSCGLSLGDRACLSLGIRLGVPVLTTDQVWVSLDLPVTVHVVR
ncbi:MAG: type II toxin-antitoxin system VapC family toxin [Gammaproteobacteria bacterium]